MAAVESTPKARNSTAAPSKRPRFKARERLLLAAMVGVPFLLVLWLVWLPALGSVALSFGKWNGIGEVSNIEWVGWRNYQDIVSIYPPFWPAVRNNLIWLLFLFVLPTVLGVLLAVILDREMMWSRFYQTAFYLPVVLSLALVGFIWQLFYSRDQGLINDIFHGQVDWYGDPNVNRGVPDTRSVPTVESSRPAAIIA